MREKRRFAALLTALALAACLVAVPAVATEGTPPMGHTQMPDHATGITTPQDPETAPVPPEPATPPPDPVTPPPSSSSSQEPPSSTPSQEPSQEPSESSQEPSSSSSSPSEAPSESSQEPGSSSSSEDPGSSSSLESSESGVDSSSSSEPSESEIPWEEPSQSQGETGGTTDHTEIPDYKPQTIATPRPAVERPTVSLNLGGSASAQPEESGPNYVTFARLNVKGNSMASTLFLGGMAFVVAGVAGLVAILIFYLRGRRRYSSAEGILQEIHEAEVRQQPFQGGADYAEPSAPAARKASPGALMPEEASLYTEEFSVPQQEPYQSPAEYGPYEGNGDHLEESGYDPYQEQEASYEEYPQEPEPPVQAPLDQTQRFDTEEILREALRFTGDDHKN